MRNTLINKGIIKNDCRRFWLLSLATFIITFFTIPFCMMISSSNDSNSMYMMEKIFYLGGNSYITLILIMIFALGLAIFLNSYMHNKKEMVFTNSLPIRKDTRILSSFCSMLIILVLPIIINMIITVLVKYINNVVIISCDMILLCFASLLVAAILTYCVTLFMTTITGNAKMACISTITISSLFYLIYKCIVEIFKLFVCGYAGDRNADCLRLCIEASPLIRILKMEQDMPSIKECIIYFAISIILLILAIVVYKKRKNERVGDSFVFVWLKRAFVYFITASSIVPSLLLFAEISKNNFFVSYLGMIIGMFFAYFISQMIVQKSVFVWRKYKEFIGCVIVFILCSLAIKYDITGYETKMPKREDIEGVYIENNNFSDERFGKIEYMADTAVIDAIYGINKDISKLSITKFDYDSNMEKGMYSISDSEKKFKKIIYKLKNGKKFERIYIANTDSINSKFVDLFNMQAYKEEQMKLFFNENMKVSDEEFIITGLYGEKIVKDIDSINAIKDALKEDYMNAKIDENMASLMRADIVANAIAIRYNHIVTIDEDDRRLPYYEGNQEIEIFVSNNFGYLDLSYKNTIDVLKRLGIMEKIYKIDTIAASIAIYEVDTNDIANIVSLDNEDENFRVFGLNWERIYIEEEYARVKKIVDEKAERKIALTDENDIINCVFNKKINDISPAKASNSSIISSSIAVKTKRISNLIGFESINEDALNTYDSDENNNSNKNKKTYILSIENKDKNKENIMIFLNEEYARGLFK